MTLPSLIISSLLAFVSFCGALPSFVRRADDPWDGSGPDILNETTSKPGVSPKLLQAAAASAVPVGTIITSCTQPGTVALTFDDGPHIYTERILNTLRTEEVKATFFVNGQNWGNINDNKLIVDRIVDEGHQLGSHTWSHKDLATLDRAGIESELRQLEDVLIQIVGKYPSYFRPPYFSSNDLVLRTAGDLGYHVINADIDTRDWANQGNIQISLQNFIDGLNAGGSIALSHDVHQQTADVLVPAMIQEVLNRGLRAVTVGECLGDPAENWYRTR